MKRINTGVKGLDAMLGGGFIPNQIAVVIGPFGAGKTVMGLQFINKGLKQEEKAIYISLEEREEELANLAKGFGWEPKPWIDLKRLTFIKLDALDLKASTRRLGELVALFKSSKPKRVVVDSITLFEMLFDNELERRRKLYDFCYALRESGANILLTSEVSESNPTVSRFGLVEYLADVVILMRLRRDKLRAMRSIEVIKMRGAAHSSMIKLYSIGDKGIHVHARAGISPEEEF